MELDGLKTLESFSKEELIALVQDMSKRWLAHDGVWFQCVENKYGMEEAVEMDAQAWDRFAQIEATRIMKLHKIPPDGGLPALVKALELRQYSFLNVKEVVELSDNKLIFRMTTCRVQATRKWKEMPAFPCKPVGILEYTSFARTIDPRIKTRCLTCHPDNNHADEYNCEWEFTI
ncbi:MAG: hypothetical protein A4E52_01356 [Pelotomaculum sp. PtaB.Bin013]|nr:MAG: hypothetical protein A4E52_01356 [Pelotomaculum sp. PtaB.Bin013]